MGMDSMSELARKRPAQVVVPGTLPRTEILTAGLHDKQALMRQVHAMASRGEIGHAYALERVRTGWAVKVVRIAERPSWWSRNGLRASLWSTAGLAFLAATAYVLRLLALALAAVLPLLAGAAVLLVIVGAVVMVSRGSSVEVTQRVTVRRW